MYCRNCRTLIPDDSIFCENCGAPTGLVPEDLVDFTLASDEDEPVEAEAADLNMAEPAAPEVSAWDETPAEPEVPTWEQAPVEPEVTSWKERPAEDYVAELDEILGEFTWKDAPEDITAKAGESEEHIDVYILEPEEGLSNPDDLGESAEYTWNEEPVVQPVTEPAYEPEEFTWGAEPVYEPVTESEPVPVVEPVVEPEPALEPEEFDWEDDDYESDFELEPVEEPEEFTWETEPVYEPVTEPAPEPAPVEEPEPAPEPEEFDWEEEPDFDSDSEFEDEVADFVWEKEPTEEFVTEPVEVPVAEPAYEPEEFTWDAEPVYEPATEPVPVVEPEPAPVADPTEFDWNETPVADTDEMEWTHTEEPIEGFVAEPMEEQEELVRDSSVPVDPVWWQPPESEADRRLREEQAAADAAAAEMAAADSSEERMLGEQSEDEESAFHIDTDGLKQAAAAAVTQAKPFLEKAGFLLKNLGKNVRTGTGWAVDVAKEQLHQMQEDRDEKKTEQEQSEPESFEQPQEAAEATTETAVETAQETVQDLEAAPAAEQPEEADRLITEDQLTEEQEADVRQTEADTWETEADSEEEPDEADEASEADEAAETKEESASSDEADSEGFASKIMLWRKSRDKSRDKTKEKREKPEEDLGVEIEEKVDQYPGFWYGAEAPIDEQAEVQSEIRIEEVPEEPEPIETFSSAADLPSETPMPVEESREVKLADTGVFHWNRTDKAVSREEMAEKVAAAAAGFGILKRFAGPAEEEAPAEEVQEAAADLTEAPEFSEAEEAAGIVETPEVLETLEASDNLEASGELEAADDLTETAGYTEAPEDYAVSEEVGVPEETEAADEFVTQGEPQVSDEFAAPEEFEAPDESETPGEPETPEEAEMPEEPSGLEETSVLNGYIGLPEGEEPVEPDEPDLYRIKDYSKTRERVTIKRSRKNLKEPKFKKPRKEMTRKDWMIIAIIAAVLILAGVIIGIQAHRIHEQKLADEAFAAHMKQAHQLVQREKYKKAEVLYLQLIAERPEDVDPYLGLANMYMAQERYRDAKALIKRGIKATGDRESFQTLKDDIKVLTSTVWKEEYIEVLEDNEYDIKKYESRVQAPVAVCDVNGDMKPELFFFTMEYYGYGKLHIYTTVNDEAKEVEYDCKNRSTKYTDAFYDVSPNNCTYVILNSADTGEFAIYANNTYNGDSWDTINTYNLNLNGGCRRLHVMQGDIDTTYSEAETDDSKYILDGEDITYDRYLADFKSMLDNSREVILYNGTGGDQSVQTKVKPGNVMCMSYDDMMLDLGADD